MRHIIFVLLSLLALSASPRKINTKHSIEKSHISSVCVHIDTIVEKNYILYIHYRDSIPSQWELHGSSHGVSSDSDPRTWPVFFNPRAPKYFHSQFDCKKIGEYRKLQEIPIEEFLKSHKETLLCPDCIAKFRGYFFVTQILLSE